MNIILCKKGNAKKLCDSKVKKKINKIIKRTLSMKTAREVSVLDLLSCLLLNLLIKRLIMSLANITQLHKSIFMDNHSPL